MDRTLKCDIHWKAVEYMQYFTVVLFVIQFSLVGNFGKFITFRLDTVRSERVNSKSLLNFTVLLSVH